jgi:hypothetical protein
MKKLVQALFLIVCVISLGVAVYFFVQNRSAAAEANRPVTTRKLLSSQQTEDAPDEGEVKAEKEATTNHIAALPNETVLDVSNVNLDQDEGDEQILTVRKTDKAGDHLSIVVADYVPQRRGWVRAWEGETLATKLSTFQIQIQDLIGDHNLDIICTGMDNDNNQTLSAFRRITGPDPNILCYSPVAAIAADSVAVEEVERSEGYQLGQTNGVSWNISAYASDKDSQNLLDQVKTTFVWDPHHDGYIEKERQKIPGAQVEREAAARVLTGKEKDFEGFLQGAWYESGKSPTDSATKMLVFDKSGSSIIFYSLDAQEDFTWNESHSTRYGLYVGCQNESVSNLRRLMDIELTGSDRISVRVFEDLQMKVDTEDRWDGSYQKLPLSVSRQGAANGTNTPAASSSAIQGLPFALSGSYRALDGSLFHFDGQHYSHEGRNPKESGGYSLYKLGDDVVCELTLLKSTGIIAERRTYRAVYSETKTEKTSVKRIVLSPARATISGLELLETGDIVLEQH